MGHGSKEKLRQTIGAEVVCVCVGVCWGLCVSVVCGEEICVCVCLCMCMFFICNICV